MISENLDRRHCRWKSKENLKDWYAKMQVSKIMLIRDDEHAFMIDLTILFRFAAIQTCSTSEWWQTSTISCKACTRIRRRYKPKYGWSRWTKEWSTQMGTWMVLWWKGYRVSCFTYQSFTDIADNFVLPSYSFWIRACHVPLELKKYNCYAYIVHEY